jgi:hypothetical protein
MTMHREMAEALEAAYAQAMAGGERGPDLVTIWCDHCQRTHWATLKGGDICEMLRGEIEEARRAYAEVS